LAVVVVWLGRFSAESSALELFDLVPNFFVFRGGEEGQTR